MRRTPLILIAAVLVASLLAFLLANPPTFAQASGLNSPLSPRGFADVADLKSQLEAGLRTRRPQEFQFVAIVVAQVERGRLSRKMVLETFHWARRRQPYPFPYFKRAMEIRAQRLRVSLAPR